MSTLSVAIREDLIAEFILRSRGRIDVSFVFEEILESYLERTRGDPDIWSVEHAEEVEDDVVDEQLDFYGNPLKGYRWQSLFLPNGTKLKMKYRGEEKIAEVRHQQIYYNEKPCSPSQFASQVANNTSRDAWRDIWILRPNDKDWVFSGAERNK